MSNEGRSSARACWTFMAVGIVAIAMFYALPKLVGMGAEQADTFYDLYFAAISFTAFWAVVAGIVLNRPRAPFPWYVLAAAQLAYSIGDILYFTLQAVTGEQPSPSIADVFYLLQYPLIIWALLVFIRRRTPNWHGTAFADAAIVAIAAGLVSWVYLLSRIAEDAGTTGADRVVSLAYPLMDLVVLSVALRLALGSGARTIAYRLLLAELVAMLIGDAVYGLQSLNDTFSESGISNGVVMMSYVLLGSAALHPSMRLLDRRAPVTDPVTSRKRLAALTGAVLLPLVILLVEHLRGRSGHLSAIAVCGGALVVLLVLRLAGLARAQRRFAITDGLTGAYAREFLAGGLQLECQRAQHTQRPLAVVSLDVDHFKLLNDTYGHPAGDRVLCELTQRVRNGLQPGDVLARVGGDEFVVVVPNANQQWVGQLAEWVRDVVSATQIEVDGDVRVRVTVSLGVASFPFDGATAQALLNAADQARQAAKGAGRNRTFSGRGPVRSA